MALVISGKDLEGLFGQPASMDLLLEVISETLRACSRGKITSQGGFPLPLADGKRNFRVLTASLPNAGVVLRTYPLFTGAKDSHCNLLFDGQTGDLLALIAGGELNVWRTGAPAGIACRLLAKRDARVLGLLGSGRQAKGQLLAIRSAMPSLEKIRVFSPNDEHRTRFARQMSSWLEIQVEAVDHARQAVEGADIVDLATNARLPVLESNWISAGALIISIGSGQLPRELVCRSRVFTSSKEELLNFRPPREPYSTMNATGIWSANQSIEVGEVSLGRQQGRQSQSEVILFELVGMPAWDAAASAWAYHWALDHKSGTFFSLA
ncbi:MAG: ornithine cyclodeaminase family protein [Candidatus Binatia bacterium]